MTIDKCVHTEHCCSEHGCKYGDEFCPVELSLKKQSFPCEHCVFDATGQNPEIGKISSQKDYEAGYEAGLLAGKMGIAGHIPHDSIVTYRSKNEFIICMLSVEPEFLKEHFGSGTGRYLEEYERNVLVELHAIFNLQTRAWLVNG